MQKVDDENKEKIVRKKARFNLEVVKKWMGLSTLMQQVGERILRGVHDENILPDVAKVANDLITDGIDYEKGALDWGDQNGVVFMAESKPPNAPAPPQAPPVEFVKDGDVKREVEP